MRQNKSVDYEKLPLLYLISLPKAIYLAFVRSWEENDLSDQVEINRLWLFTGKINRQLYRRRPFEIRRWKRNRFGDLTAGDNFDSRHGPRSPCICKGLNVFSSGLQDDLFTGPFKAVDFPIRFPISLI